MRVSVTDTAGDDSEIASVSRHQCRDQALSLEYAGTEPILHCLQGVRTKTR